MSHPEGIYANGWAKQAMPASGSTDVKFTIVVKEQGIEHLLVHSAAVTEIKGDFLAHCTSLKSVVFLLPAVTQVGGSWM